MCALRFSGYLDIGYGYCWNWQVHSLFSKLFTLSLVTTFALQLWGVAILLLTFYYYGAIGRIKNYWIKPRLWEWSKKYSSPRTQMRCSCECMSTQCTSILPWVSKLTSSMLFSIAYKNTTAFAVLDLRSTIDLACAVPFLTNQISKFKLLLYT